MSSSRSRTWAWLALVTAAAASTAGCGGHRRTITLTSGASSVSTATTVAPTAGAPPVQGGTTRPGVTGVTGVTGATGATGAAVVVRVLGPGPSRVEADARDVTALAFEVQNLGPDDVELRGLTLQARGRLDDAAGVRTARLAKDTDGDGRFERTIDATLTGAGFASDDGDLAFPLLAGVLLRAGETFQGLVALDLSGSAWPNDDVRLLLSGPAALDLVATSGGPVSVAAPVAAGPSHRVGGFVEPHIAFELPGDGLAPRAVRDPLGRTHVVLFQNHNFNSDVFYTLFDGRRFSTPFEVSQVPRTAWNPDIAVDAAGVPHLVWEEDQAGGDYAIRYTRFDPATFAWTAHETVSTGQAMSLAPRIAIGAAGEVHVAWEDWSQGSASRVHHRRRDPGGWSSVTDVSAAPAGVQAQHPDLAVLPSGDVLVVWAENTAGRNEVRARPLLASGGVGPLERVHASGQVVERPTLAHEAGLTHLAWSTGGEVLYARRDALGWSVAVDVSRSPATHSTEPALAVVPTPNGGAALHVAWIEADPTRIGTANQVAHARAQGGGFAPPALLTRGNGYRISPTLVAEGARVRVLWQDWGLGRQRIFTTWSEPGDLLEAPRVALTVGGEPSRPAAARGPLGDLHVAYAVDAGGNHEVFHALEAEPGRGFLSVENVSKSPTPSYAPSVAAVGSTAWAAWEEQTPSGFEVRVARRDPTGWSSAAALSSDTPAYAPRLAAAEDGRLALVWSEAAPAGDHDLRLRLHDASGWSAAVSLGADPASSAWSPDAAFTASGELVVVWEDEAHGGREVRVAQRDRAGVTHVAAVASGSSTQHAPRVACRGEEVHVAWLEGGRVRVAVRRPGQATFDAPIDLTSGGSGSVDIAVHGAHASAEVLVAWEQWTQSDARALFAVLPPASPPPSSAPTWSAPAPLDRSTEPTRRVTAIGTVTGGAAVLWTEGGDLLVRERKEQP